MGFRSWSYDSSGPVVSEQREVRIPLRPGDMPGELSKRLGNWQCPDPGFGAVNARREQLAGA